MTQPPRDPQHPNRSITEDTAPDNRRSQVPDSQPAREQQQQQRQPPEPPADRTIKKGGA
jgi:hypothetical protein